MHRDSFLSDMGPRSSADGDRLSILSQGPVVAVPLEIRLLSDVELIGLTNTLRRGLLAYAWLSLPLASGLAWLAFGPMAAAIAAVVAIGGSNLAARLYERSNATHRALLAKREFCARYHIGSLTVDEAAAVGQLAEEPQLDGVLLFRAWALPHGGHRFIRIELGATHRIAVYTTPFLGDLQRRPDTRALMAKLEQPLSDAQNERLVHVLSELTPSKMQNIPQRVVVGQPLDGLPCDVVVLRRGAETLRASMNFRGVASLERLSPAEDLVSTVLALESEIVGRESFDVDPLLTRDYADLVGVT
jgi:hypothetical protein